jgi:hypothetical protein
MKATQLLYRVGQSLWLDNITRDLLTSGTLKRYIDELSITGLTSAAFVASWNELLGVIASKSASLAKAS